MTFQAKLRFGPAGIPIECKGKSLSEGIEYAAKQGLHALEVEFVRGVRGRKEEWVKARKTAEDNDVLLSCHAPYWTNCCSPLKEKQEIAIRNLLQTARAAELLGAYIIVFHPGYYQNLSKEVAMKNTTALLKQLEKKMKAEKLHTKLGAETTGKVSAFGNLHEVIELTKKIEAVYPVIDFAHLHARNNGGIKREDDFKQIINTIKKELGKDYLKQMHCHFSGINFSEKGEQNHLPISSLQPDFKKLARIIKSNKYSFTIISESPLLDKDALKMQDIIRTIF
jgi:deoxyribonuclease-4